MSHEWAERQRRTNKLVRFVATHVLRREQVSPEQLYGLCKLTWITSSYESEDAGYIQSTKIPGLGDALRRNYEGCSLKDVASDVARILKSDEASTLVLGHTGFTHFYKPYRNSCRGWLKTNRVKITELFRRGYKLRTDGEGHRIARAISALPGVPKANVDGKLMRPEYLLSPTLFALDERIRFPLINGNDGVQKLLKVIGAAGSPLDEQYLRMVELYGQGGIKDAADLDQVGRDLPDLIKIGGKQPTKKLLERRSTTGTALAVKDEEDIKTLQKARSVTHRRLHNVLTNRLLELLASFTLLEGSDSEALFDVLVKNYNRADDDLQIEAKSSAGAPHIRMAVGQLYDYWFKIKRTSKPHLAILVPEKPNSSTIAMLEWLDIGLLWIKNGTLKTNSASLKELCTE